MSYSCQLVFFSKGFYAFYFIMFNCLGGKETFLKSFILQEGIKKNINNLYIAISSSNWLSHLKGTTGQLPPASKKLYKR